MPIGDQAHSPSENQLEHIIKEQFEAPVKCLLKEGHTISAAKLILSGIDLMGYLTLPDGRQKVDDRAFKKWTRNYLNMVKSGRLDPEEIWQTRCDLLHAHGYRDHAEDKPLRCIVFSELSTPPAYEYSNEIDFVLVPIEEFLQEFLSGARRCKSNLYGEENKSSRTQTRLEHVQYMRREYVTLDGHRITLDGVPVTIDWHFRHLRHRPGEDS